MRRFAMMCCFAGVMLASRADIPSNDRPISNEGERGTSYGQILAGLALAGALGVGGVMAVRHLREKSEKPNANQEAPATVGAESK